MPSKRTKQKPKSVVRRGHKIVDLSSLPRPRLGDKRTYEPDPKPGAKRGNRG